MLVSIIIPRRSDKVSVDGLLKDISSQKILFSTETVVITGISPSGRARNNGASQAKGEILVFFDCDIRLGNEFVLANLIDALQQNDKIGAVCASIRTPDTGSKFQKRYAQEVPHAESPVVEQAQDVAVATSACCAIKKDVFDKIGRFNYYIGRGEDPELSLRLIKAGYRVILVPKTWAYHPQPDNLKELININIRNGLGASFVDIFYPGLNVDVDPKGILYTPSKISILGRILRFLTSFLEAVIKGKVVLLLAKVFYLIGYFRGIIEYRILKLNRPKNNLIK